MADAIDIREQLIILTQKAAIDEVVTLDTRESGGVLSVSRELRDVVRILAQMAVAPSHTDHAVAAWLSTSPHWGW